MSHFVLSPFKFIIMISLLPYISPECFIYDYTNFDDIIGTSKFVNMKYEEIPPTYKVGAPPHGTDVGGAFLLGYTSETSMEKVEVTKATNINITASFWCHSKTTSLFLYSNCNWEAYDFCKENDKGWHEDSWYVECAVPLKDITIEIRGNAKESTQAVGYEYIYICADGATVPPKSTTMQMTTTSTTATTTTLPTTSTVKTTTFTSVSTTSTTTTLPTTSAAETTLLTSVSTTSMTSTSPTTSTAKTTTPTSVSTTSTAATSPPTSTAKTTTPTSVSTKSTIAALPTTSTTKTTTYTLSYATSTMRTSTKTLSTSSPTTEHTDRTTPSSESSTDSIPETTTESSTDGGCGEPDCILGLTVTQFEIVMVSSLIIFLILVTIILVPFFRGRRRVYVAFVEEAQPRSVEMSRRGPQIPSRSLSTRRRSADVNRGYEVRIPRVTSQHY